MSDPEFDHARRIILSSINSKPKEREELEKVYGKVWDTKQLQEEFNVHSFLAPFCSVTRKSDQAKGAVAFQHSPRYYFEFVQEKKDG